jgi:hypothetical protein
MSGHAIHIVIALIMTYNIMKNKKICGDEARLVPCADSF